MLLNAVLYKLVMTISENVLTTMQTPIILQKLYFESFK